MRACVRDGGDGGGDWWRVPYDTITPGDKIAHPLGRISEPVSSTTRKYVHAELCVFRWKFMVGLFFPKPFIE